MLPVPPPSRVQRGPMRGPARGPNTPGSTPGPSIYAQLTAVDVESYCQTVLSSADAYQPSFLLTCDEAAGNLVDLIGALELVANGGAATVVSPHGRAAGLVSATNAYWRLAAAAAMEVGAGAFAFAIRARFTAHPAFQVAFLSRSGTASPHYQFNIDATGQPGVQAKRNGAPTKATVAANVVDGAWRWYVGGRSLVLKKTPADIAGVLALAVDAGDATAVFDASIDLTTFGGGLPFGLCNAANGQEGAIDGEVDHVIGWLNPNAENVIANRVALGAALAAGG